MQSTRQRLLALLADGKFHSGEALGEMLGVSRAAVWKHVAAIDALGLTVERAPGQGYRLARPLDLLDARQIDEALSIEARQCLQELRVVDSVDSTNALLMREPATEFAQACIAEQQTSGRGRRSRPWVSPFGANLYLSLSWPFSSLPPDFPALGLAMGVATRRALQELDLGGICLKWPNDLYAAGAKLGGILLEMRGEPPGPCRLVAGIGINVMMPPEAAADVDQAWIDLAQLSNGEPPSRNVLAAGVLNQWVSALSDFEQDGFARFLPEWREADMLSGRLVTIFENARQWQGTARGVAPDGALEIDTAAGIKRFVSGDATIREAG